MKYFIYSGALLLTLCFSSCEDNRENKTVHDDDVPQREIEKPLSNVEIQLQERVMSREEQEQLQPETVVQMLKDGNSRFLDNRLTAHGEVEFYEQ